MRAPFRQRPNLICTPSSLSPGGGSGFPAYRRPRCLAPGSDASLSKSLALVIDRCGRKSRTCSQAAAGLKKEQLAGDASGKWAPEETEEIDKGERRYTHTSATDAADAEGEVNTGMAWRRREGHLTGELLERR